MMIDATVAPQGGCICSFGTTVCHVNHSNAVLHLPLETGATQERRLEAVRCKWWLAGRRLSQPPEPGTDHATSARTTDRPPLSQPAAPGSPSPPQATPRCDAPDGEPRARRRASTALRTTARAMRA